MSTNDGTVYPLGVHHEICTCGHCRCDHAGGFAACTACRACSRYTWPGRGADLPAMHTPKARFKYRPRHKTRSPGGRRDAAWDSEARLRDMEGWGDYEGPRTWP